MDRADRPRAFGARLDTAIGALFPGWGLARARARLAADAVMHYKAATHTGRAGSWRAVRTDADGAALAARWRLAAVAQDMVRNTPLAARVVQVVANNVVGDGIIPKPVAADARLRDMALSAIRAHMDTVAIDATGRANLYGLQRLAMQAVVADGECLVRIRWRERSEGLPLPFQMELLEAAFLDATRDGATRFGTEIREGIEYDRRGRRVAYWLHTEHPGGQLTRLRSARDSVRVPAREVLHLYRQDRPGQMRGVSWLAPVALQLQDLADHQEAQVMRQKIAACFAAFRVSPEAQVAGTDTAGLDGTIKPGRIQNIAPGEDIRFAVPPGVEGYDEFTTAVIRDVAAGIGVTYEALSGDLSRVNYSSARMGRMEMDRNVNAWQWTLMIPQMLQPLGAVFAEALALQTGRPLRDLGLDWVPPHRMLVDPVREIPALRDKVRAGFASRQAVIRELGYDPEAVLAEQLADAQAADGAGLVFDSDARMTAQSGAAQSAETAGDDGEPSANGQTGLDPEMRAIVAAFLRPGRAD